MQLIDRFDANQTAIERKEGQSLKELKSIATMRSVRASNRIEGNRISDEEVDVLIQAMDITEMRMKFGYFEVLDLISESHENNNITENHIKNVHDSLLKYRAKDEGQKGDYQMHSNAVEALFPVLTKLQQSDLETQLSPKEKSVYTIIQNRPNIHSGEMAKKLAIQAPTVKRILSELLKKGLSEKQGNGRNVSYTIK